MTTKITEHHLSREACIYLRQSTPGQVRFNRESTERQYQLSSRARELGWPPERIRVLDRDLGQSSSMTRDDFKTLVNGYFDNWYVTAFLEAAKASGVVHLALNRVGRADEAIARLPTL